MTPVQARRLFVLRENHREQHIGERRQRVDWVVLLFWVGILATSVVVTGVVFVVAVTLFRWLIALLRLSVGA